MNANLNPDPGENSGILKEMDYDSQTNRRPREESDSEENPDPKLARRHEAGRNLEEFQQPRTDHRTRSSSTTMSSWLEKPIKGVLLDITGVLYESGEGNGTVIPGSVEAIEKLKANGIPVRLVTNETCATRTAVINKLSVHGYKVSEADIFSPVPAMVAILKARGLSPHLLVHPSIEDEFKDVIKDSPSCVVIGDADEAFTFENMNVAFRTLVAMDKPTLFSLGFGKYYKHKGILQLDVGAFASALEFACDVKSEIVGKPSQQFFGAALSDIGVKAEEAVMVGDDIVSDVGGAQKCGMRGVLVRTGKFTTSWESHPYVTPDFIADNLAEAWPLQRLLLGEAAA